MDACDQLLLSEGVCRQLGILQYHPSVQPCSGEDDIVELTGNSKLQSSEATAMVPTVRVRLLQSQAVPPLQRVAVEVKADSSGPPHSLMVEPLHPMKGVLVEPSLLHIQGGTAFLEVTNQTGFTQHLEEGLELGEAIEATVLTAQKVEDEVPEVNDQTASLTLDQDDMMYLRRVSQGNGDEWRMTRVREQFQKMLPLDPKQSETFCRTLEGCHQAFSLEEGERGETALVQLEIDTGDAAPRQQRPRRIPFALREEVSKQLKNLQESGVIQPSNSPWASPVFLVRKRDGTHRFCVDYRKVNSVTKKDKFPCPVWMTSWTSSEILVTTPRWTWRRGIGRLESTRSHKPRLTSSHTKACMSSWSCPLG